MKRNQKGFSSVVILSVIIVVGIAGTVGWLVIDRHKKNDKKVVTATQVSKTNTQTKSAEATPAAMDPYAGWKTYESTDKSLVFKYPGNWFARQDSDLPRVYASTSNAAVTKDDMPADFQQIWVTAGSEEASAENENSVKSGEPNGRMVSGSVVSSIVKSGDLVIHTYEYNTVGGKTIQAFWTGKSGQRYYATNSTEVGQINQQNMVDNLKKILASVVAK